MARDVPTDSNCSCPFGSPVTCNNTMTPPSPPPPAMKVVVVACLLYIQRHGWQVGLLHGSGWVTVQQRTLLSTHSHTWLSDMVVWSQEKQAWNFQPSISKPCFSAWRHSCWSHQSKHSLFWSGHECLMKVYCNPSDKMSRNFTGNHRNQPRGGYSDTAYCLVACLKKRTVCSFR